MVTQSRRLRYRRSVFSTSSTRRPRCFLMKATISPKEARPACFAVSTSTNSCEHTQVTIERIAAKEIKLRRDREAFALLVLRGDAGVDEGRGHERQDSKDRVYLRRQRSLDEDAGARPDTLRAPAACVELLKVSVYGRSSRWSPR